MQIIRNGPLQDLVDKILDQHGEKDRVTEDLIGILETHAWLSDPDRPVHDVFESGLMAGKEAGAVVHWLQIYDFRFYYTDRKPESIQKDLQRFIELLDRD